MPPVYRLVFFFSFCISTLATFGQYAADSIVALNSQLNESSGLIILNNTFVTHNDSGGEPALYEIDTTTGGVQRTVYLKNATNVDWEDITADFTHIYIADIGNNNGTRKNLRIYKIAQADFWASDTVVADTISFNYANQTDFTSQPFATNFDAEALVHFNDSLFVFTKQWSAHGGCRVYGMPKVAGSYTLPVHDSIGYVGGVVTAADMIHDALVDALVLLINGTEPRLHGRYNIVNSKFSTGTNSDNHLLLPGSLQAEGLATQGRNRYYFTSEDFFGKPSVLSVLRKNPLFDVVETSAKNFIKIYPNPSTSSVYIECKIAGKLELYSHDGRLISTQQIDAQKQKIISLPEQAGTYVAKFFLTDGSTIQQMLIKL